MGVAFIRDVGSRGFFHFTKKRIMPRRTQAMFGWVGLVGRVVGSVELFGLVWWVGLVGLLGLPVSGGWVGWVELVGLVGWLGLAGCLG